MYRLLLCLLLLAGLAAPTAEAVEIKRNLTYVDGEDPRLLDAYLPEGVGPHPVVLIVHGGSWRQGSKEQLSVHAWALAQAGFAAFAINYRLAPEHKWPAQIEDCQAALRWIGEQAEVLKLDVTRIGAFGYSAGGHLAAHLGTAPAANTPRLRAVCAGGAPVDFRYLPPESTWFAYWLGGSPGQLPEVYREASPLAFVSKDDPPFLFVHGEDDSVVRVAGPVRMVEELTRRGVEAEVKVIDGMGHIGAALHPRTVQWTVEFFTERLGTRAP